MSTETEELEQLLAALPADLRREVKHFAEFLLKRSEPTGGARIKQNWAGSLKDHRDQYTALSLQSKSLDWRGD